MRLPCFPFFAAWLRKHEEVIMSNFDEEVAYCRFQCFLGMTTPVPAHLQNFV